MSAVMDEKTPRASSEKSAEKSAVPVKDDVEAGSSNGLQRGMNSWHLQFIAIGGTVGTGLFLGTGSALATAGPVSLLIAFIFVGSVVFSVMTSLSEMATYLPVSGSFTTYATRFVDPTLGFAMGWTYWFSWSITFALELTAAGLIIQYWSSLSIAIWIAVFWVIITAINFLPVRVFGQLEMWFSMIKVLTIVGFIIFAICINAGVGDQGYLGFSYWKNPGAFAEYMVDGATGKFVGFWAVLITAGFSFQGSELVGIGAGETADPRTAIPRAVRWTFWGIFSLFIATVFFIGIVVPYDDASLQNDSTNASASPLVIAANLAGVPVLPDIINAVLLSAVLTAANSNVYSSSRIMVALAEEGHAPRFLTRTNRHGIPYFAVTVVALVGLLGFMNLSEDGTVVFNWFISIVSVAGFITWALLNVCHIRFMRVLADRGIARTSLHYYAPLQPYLSWFGLFFNVLIIITNGFTVFIEWSTSDFFTCYISVLLFLVLYIGHKIVFRTKVVPLSEVDIVKGRLE
jgi:amino acid transporter